MSTNSLLAMRERLEAWQRNPGVGTVEMCAGFPAFGKLGMSECSEQGRFSHSGGLHRHNTADQTQVVRLQASRLPLGCRRRTAMYCGLCETAADYHCSGQLSWHG